MVGWGVHPDVPVMHLRCTVHERALYFKSNFLFFLFIHLSYPEVRFCFYYWWLSCVSERT